MAKAFKFSGGDYTGQIMLATYYEVDEFAEGSPTTVRVKDVSENRPRHTTNREYSVANGRTSCDQYWTWLLDRYEAVK